MKTTLQLVTKKALLVGFLLVSLLGNAQHFTVTLANFTSTTTTFEVDIVLIVNAPSEGIRLSAVTTYIHFNPAILNGGTPCTAINCGSWMYIPGTRSTAILALDFNRETYSEYPNMKILRNSGTPLTETASIHILPGTYTLGRYRFTNTVAWTANTDAQLYLGGGFSTTQLTSVIFYTYGATTPLNTYTVTNPVGGTGLTLGYTESSPMLRILNPGLSTVENTVNPLQVSPNPFSTAFNLSFDTISNEQVTVKVYDMIGKLIDNRTVEANTINTLQLGANYQAGIYNVSVAQGEKSQTSRVIKR